MINVPAWLAWEPEYDLQNPLEKNKTKKTSGRDGNIFITLVRGTGRQTWHPSQPPYPTWQVPGH